MANYKEMYLTMVKASEQAINTLVAAQREAEEIYISTPEPDVILLPQEPPYSHEKTEQ